MERKFLNYNDYDKAGKRQITSFIRKVYDCTYINIRDIISDQYQAIAQDGKLIGVSFKLESPKK